MKYIKTVHISAHHHKRLRARKPGTLEYHVNEAIKNYLNDTSVAYHGGFGEALRKERKGPGDDKH